MCFSVLGGPLSWSWPYRRCRHVTDMSRHEPPRPQPPAAAAPSATGRPQPPAAPLLGDHLGCRPAGLEAGAAEGAAQEAESAAVASGIDAGYPRSRLALCSTHKWPSCRPRRGLASRRGTPRTRCNPVPCAYKEARSLGVRLSLRGENVGQRGRLDTPVYLVSEYWWAALRRTVPNPVDRHSSAEIVGSAHRVQPSVSRWAPSQMATGCRGSKGDQIPAWTSRRRHECWEVFVSMKCLRGVGRTG